MLSPKERMQISSNFRSIAEAVREFAKVASANNNNNYNTPVINLTNLRNLLHESPRKPS